MTMNAALTEGANENVYRATILVDLILDHGTAEDVADALRNEIGEGQTYRTHRVSFDTLDVQVTIDREPEPSDEDAS